MAKTATLIGEHGTLRISVLGFEFDDARGARGDDGEWLVARVEWEGKTARVSHEGAILLTTELAAFAQALADPGRGGLEALRFLEPNFSLTREPVDGGSAERVTVAIAGEPREGSPTFAAGTRVSSDDLRAFGRALRRISQGLRRAWPAVA